MTGVYIHIPYCVKKCGYCDFYSVCDLTSSNEYINAVCRELNRMDSASADTLYIGGGTPSLIGPGSICKIIDSAKRLLTKDAEITVEVNPGDDLSELIPALSESGVNRLSVGMQSHNDEELRLLTRRHNADDVAIAIDCARKNGIDNVSLDVMLGIQGQTLDSLKETLDFCSAAGVTHVSAYMLKIESDTPFYMSDFRPSDDLQSDMYLFTVEHLRSLGFEQYEISNFCRDLKRSLHNMKYWTGQDYVGVGAAAHSFVNGRRYYYPRSVISYISGAKPIDDGEGGGFDEKVMLGLRLTDGIDLNKLSGLFPEQSDRIELIKQKAQMLCRQGLAEYKSGILKLTPRGFLVSNSIISMLI